MSRYIDADAAIARIAGQMSYEIEVETGNETDCVDLAEELLNDIPSIDIEPKRGEWIDKGKNLWECSNCEMVIYSESEQDRNEFHKWCSRCGSRMKGADDE